MAYNFLACDRDQAFLLPPDVREWLPADHLAWFVLDVVDQLDLGPFLRAYRADGHGRAAYQPRMLLGVLLRRRCSATLDMLRTRWPNGPQLPLRTQFRAHGRALPALTAGSTPSTAGGT
jgi:hypothetical protein